MLEVQDIEVYYGGIHALHSVSLHIDEGEIVSIIGSNGAGKSTLMRTIAGEKAFKSGSIRFGGAPLPGKSHEAVKQGISLVPEGRRVFANLSVRENLLIGSYPRKSQERAAAQKADLEEIITLFPRLGERLKQRAGTLSGGEQQMLAVGRALMAKPKLLCLDEPSLGLAPIVIDEMFEKIVQINKTMEQTILLVEQNAFIALEVAHRAYVLKTGEMVQEGPGKELLRDPNIQASYLGIKQ
ncbi:ABC transporter ATP-binding protein [Ruminococcaceae bacterium OttesenSCG-928-A11]|nr:ABC transporter ATP-binding protein [Ruminococcaceae bacterium OttesenSCG-928-A11]